ncbi:MFS transporter [Dactylosporangium sp. CA-052675]|uniref:MFS transporter n=1 Tax=Dactylosporangium sp. CA-052675 TaxID=3239927 RepID=UPI003D911DDD
MRRLPVYVAVVLVAALATLFGAPATSASASPSYAPGDKLCSIEEWKVPANFNDCAASLKSDIAGKASCLDAPIPDSPDAGMAGWFAQHPSDAVGDSIMGRYTQYGYAGYDFNTYDLKCTATVTNPSAEFENTVANGEFVVATSIIGASNAMRERAWDASYMWGWADPMVDRTTKAIYDRVFTPFGAITLAIVGMYLLWRSRQSDMSNAMTTAGWAIFVMVLMTALATWPSWSAQLADRALTSSLGLIHDAVGPPAQQKNSDAPLCQRHPESCIDHRTPALRASDAVTDGLLYQNWLRGTLGSADSVTAQKYGEALYDARSFTWDEIDEIRTDEANVRARNEVHAANNEPLETSSVRAQKMQEKGDRWKEIAERIRIEDPEAYQHLQGIKGMDRIGAGFLAILSALFFALFDLTASVLVILGFLLFRWAVIAAPMLGTIGLLRPANAGLRRLGNAVIAAVFNIIIFGTGSAVYLFAVSQILTAALAPWLQVVLIWLTGVVGWLLLRPYRRITQLGGKDSTRAITSAGSWHRLFMRDVRAAAALKVVDAGGTKEPGPQRSGELQVSQRPEARNEDTVSAGSGAGVAAERPETGGNKSGAGQQRPRRRESTWEEPDLPAENAPSYSIYRPGSDDSSGSTTGRGGARRPESASLPG